MKKLMLVLDHALHKQYREQSEYFGPGAKAKAKAIKNDGDLRALSLVMDILVVVLVLKKQ